MRALVYRGRGKRAFEDRPRPVITAPTDAIVRVTNVTISGSALRATRGDVPCIARGRILGHEGTGIIERIGESVAKFGVGDCVLISFLTSCGMCTRCKQGERDRCESGGWMLGNSIDGTYAEYVRVPFADHSLVRVVGAADDSASGTWTDHFPEGFRRGVFHGPDERTDTATVVFGGSVGMGPLLAVMEYYRTMVRPAIASQRKYPS